MCVLLLDHRGPSVETELFFRAPPWMSCASPPELYSGPEASDLRNWGRPKPEPTLHISETPCPNEPLLSTTTSVRVKERKKERKKQRAGWKDAIDRQWSPARHRLFHPSLYSAEGLHCMLLDSMHATSGGTAPRMLSPPVLQC
jgi:hypothetical protein